MSKKMNEEKNWPSKKDHMPSGKGRDYNPPKK